MRFTKLGSTGLDVSVICLGCMSPLARGRLTRLWDEETVRTETDQFGKCLYREEDRQIGDQVGEVADQLGTSRAQVALAWLLRKPPVTAPIVGATKPEHLADAIAAVDLELDDVSVEALKGFDVPHAIAGHD